MATGESRHAADESALVIERRFAANPERVWRAWVEPGEVAAWLWGSLSAGVVAELEVRHGGAYRVTTDRPDGGKWAVQGRYVEVDAPRRLEFTVQWDAPMGYETPDERIRVELLAQGAETVMRFTQSGVPTAEARGGHRQGWENCFEHLTRHLAQGH